MSTDFAKRSDLLSRAPRIRKIFVIVVLTTFASFVEAVEVNLVWIGTESSFGLSQPALSGTATWDWDGTVLTGTGSFSVCQTLGPGCGLFTHNIDDLVIDTANLTVTSALYECIEGTFGGAVGAHLCGNWNFGANWVNDSTIDLDGSNRVIGNDDLIRGPPQTVAEYNLPMVNWDGQWLVFDNSVPGVGGQAIWFENPDPMTANDDGTAGSPIAAARWGNTVSIDVLANDSGFNAPPYTVTTIAPAPSLGTTLVTGSPGAANAIRIEYTAGTVIGEDSFGYQITDSTGATVSATVVVGSFDPNVPMAFADADTTPTDTAIDIAVLLNDTGLFDVPLTVTVTNAPTEGTAIVNPDNTIRYVPGAGAAGEQNVTFEYTVEDANNDVSNSAVVTVALTDPNLLPTAIGFVADADQDRDVAIDVVAEALVTLGNGTLADHNIAVTLNPQNGTAVFDGGSSVTYTPNAGFFGIDKFSYTITDIDGSQDTAAISVIVMRDFQSSNSSAASLAGNLTVDGGSAIGLPGLILLLTIPWFRRRSVNVCHYPPIQLRGH